MLDRNSPFLQAADPRRPDSLADLAFRGLRDSIVACDLPPGQIATEAELSDRFAYGLAATRAALARLSALGWVVAEPRRGWRVLPVSGAHLADLCRARDLLEPALSGIAIAPALAQDLSVQARVLRADAASGLGAAPAIRHALRLHLALSQAVPEARVRGWLRDTWRLAARADICMALSLGIDAAVHDLRPLADAALTGDGAALDACLAQGRAAFAGRCRAACARSHAPILEMPPQTGPARPEQSGATTEDASPKDASPDVATAAGSIPAEDQQP